MQRLAWGRGTSAVWGTFVKSGKCMLLAVVLASVVFSAHAQSVPKPKEFYFD